MNWEYGPLRGGRSTGRWREHGQQNKSNKKQKGRKLIHSEPSFLSLSLFSLGICAKTLTDSLLEERRGHPEENPLRQDTSSI